MPTPAVHHERRQRARVHSRRRAAERFGVKLNRNGRAELLNQILTGRAKFLRVVGLRTMWLVIIGGQVGRAVYDEGLREFITLLPGGGR